MRGSNFSYLVKQGMNAVWHNRMMSFASFCILMVSLLLIGLALLFGLDIGVVIGNIEEKNEIMVFTENNLAEADVHRISETLNANQYQKSVVFRSKTEALEIFKRQMGEDYFVLFEALDENPMPDTFIVSINDLTQIENCAKEFGAIAGVEKVEAPYDFARFLTSIRSTLSIIGGAVFVALIVVCLVIVYNTTRASVFARRMEISIMRHVGATNAFIKIPFFIEGMSIGIIAGFVSWILTKIAYGSVVSLFMNNLTIWQVLGMVDIITFDQVNWYVLVADCLVGAFLGAVGTLLSMGKHLKV